MARIWLPFGVAGLFVTGLVVISPPAAQAVCGSIGGRHFDVSGCSDPLYELNDALPPPPPPGAPPPPPGAPPPPPPPVYVPPPPPNISVCANVGRRINISGCI